MPIDGISRGLVFVNHTAIRNMLEKWLEEAFKGNCRETVAYHIEGASLYICTCSVSLLKGEKSSLLEKYKDLLWKEKITSVKLVDMCEGSLKSF